MKRNFIKLTSIALMSTLALTACKPDKVESEPLLAALLSASIRASASGNCAISINNAGLHYGAIVTMAVLNGGGASSVYTNAAINTGSVKTFTEAEFLEASGTTLAALGYATYALVPYNVKYDAFFKWDATKRNNALAYTKTFRDYFLFYGNLAVSDNTGAAAAFPTGVGATAVSLVASNGSATACDTFGEVTTTCAAGISTVAASFGLVDRTNGTGTLVCARIPRTSCSVAGLTTATRAADITNQATVFNAVVDNTDCRKPGDHFNEILARVAFKGLPQSETVTLRTRAFKNTYTNLSTASVDSTTKILPENAYPKFGSLVSLGFGGLMPINKNGGNYPTDASVTSSTVYYGGTNMVVTAVDSCDAIGLGTGVTTRLAETQALTPSNEVVYAFSTNGQAAALYADITRQTNVRTGATDVTVGSGSGTSAQYDSFAFTRPVQNVDDNTCNTSFRAKTTVPIAVENGGKLPVLDVNSGDGGTTSLLSICVYGGANDAARLFAKQLLASGLTTAKSFGTVTSSMIPNCGGTNSEFKAPAFAASHNFGEFAKATTAETYPNNGN